MMLVAYLPFVALALCATPWLLVMSRRFGLSLAIGGVLAGTLILVMIALFGSSALSLQPLPTTLAVAAIAGAAGVLVLRRTAGAVRRPRRSTIAAWAPAAIGAIAWIGVVAVAQLLPGAAPLSWAMNGDTANNIHDARLFLESNGLTTLISVPLTAALLLLGMAAGRDQSGRAELLQHDLVAFTVVWALELALTAVLLGLVASALVSTHRTAVVAIASGAGSLLATTWYIAGLPIEYGYLNVHLALPFLLASWLAFLQSARFPVVAIAVELGLGVLLTTTWTPLIVFTAAFVVAILLRHRATLRVLRGRSLIITTSAVLLFLVPFTLLAVPALSSGIASFLIPGHGMPVTGGILLLLLGIVLVGAVSLRRRTALPVVDGAISASAASVLGVGVLLLIARQVSDPWTLYYPAKLTWLTTAFLVPIALGVLIGLVAQLARTRTAATAGAVALAVVSLVLVSAGPPPTRETFVITPPLVKIAFGSVWSSGDAAVAKILRYSQEDRRDLLWDTTDPDEAMINFWILEFSEGDRTIDGASRDLALRGYRELRDSGSYRAGDVGELCEVASELEPPVSIHTADAGLSSELTATCPELQVTVLVDG